MNVETSFYVSLAAVGVAAISATFAGLALRKTHASLGLQRQIDARQREFRDVRWETHMGVNHASPNGWTFRVTNSGLTPAHNVTLVIELDPDELHQCGNLAPGEGRDVFPSGAQHWHEAHRTFMPVTPGHIVHWSSPAGEADKVRFSPNLLFRHS
jgi:hypothetical protein